MNMNTNIKQVISAASVPAATAALIGSTFFVGSLSPTSVTEAASVGGGNTSKSAPFWVTRPCADEGDVNCYWDAGERGNGRGHSYIVRKVPGSTGMVCVFYVNKKYARHHDYCS